MENFEIFLLLRSSCRDLFSLQQTIKQITAARIKNPPKQEQRITTNPFDGEPVKFF